MRRNRVEAGKRGPWTCTVALTFLVSAGSGPICGQAFAQAASPSSAPDAEFVTAKDLKIKLAEKVPPTIIDVRASARYADADEKIQGAIHIKLKRLKSRLAYAPLKDLPRDREIVTYCACRGDDAGRRAAQVLREAGFTRVRTLSGGWEAWLAAGGPVERTPNGGR